MAIDPKYKPIFTVVGMSKIADAINTGVKIELKSMALGDSNGTDYTPTETMTALVREVIRFDLRTLWYEEITATNKTALKFTGVLEPGIISSKTIREVGVYDKAGDLIIIFRIPDRPVLTDGNIATVLDLTFGISLSTNSNIFMTLGDTTGNYVTLTEYNGHVNNVSNPHGVNKTQIGLPLVDNTRDIDKVVASAAKLTTTRTINGTDFDGTENIIVPINVTAKSDNIAYSLPFVSTGLGNRPTYVDSDDRLTYNPSTNNLTSVNFTGELNGNAATVSKLLLSDSANPIVGPDSPVKNTIGYVNGISTMGQIDGALYSQVHSALWQHQIFGDYRTGKMASRGKNNGVWQAWRELAYLDSSITGNSATATKLATPRTIALSGDISGSATFDGSANISITSTLPNVVTAGTYKSVTVNAKGLITSGTNPTTLDGYGITDAVTASRATATFDAAANTWYRIATSILGIGKNSGVFAVDWSRSGQHGAIRFTADCMYGNNNGTSLMQQNYSKYAGANISEARVVYHNSHNTNYAYLEVKFSEIASAVTVNVELQDSIGWILTPPNTAGMMPAGYLSKTLTFISSAEITAGTFPKVTFNQEGRVTAGTTLAATDIPALDTGKLTTGILPIERGGTGVGTSTGTGSNVLNTAPTFNRVISVGTGNGYNSGAVELIGNGPANTIFPTIGFHQPALYAGTIQLKGDGDFKFYKQNGDLGNVNASTGVFTTSVTAPTFNGNATSATGAKYQTRGAGTTCAEKFTNTPADSASISECNNVADAPNTGWWMIHSIRHSNGSNYWGVQMAYGWEGNAGLVYQRNVSSGNWSAWTRVDVSGANISELVNNVGYITTEGRAYPKRVGGVDMNFNWSGQGGQPNWLWGGNDGTNHYVYNPSNFNVNYANTAGRADDLGNHQWAGHAENGYIRLSTGFTIQWGTFNANNSNMVGTPQVINLPVAFANAIVYAGVSEDGGYSSGVETAAMDWTTPGKTTRSTIGVYTNYYGIVKFIAIGY